jgi:protein SCO1/2
MASPLQLVRLVAVLAAVCSAPAAWAQTALPPNEPEMVGRRVADARFVDENGDALDVRAFEGKPLLVSPIFTRCHHVCPMITANLNAAIADVGVVGEDFNILSVTFDAKDTEEDLRRFKERSKLPEAWKFARGESEEVLPFLDSIDFRFISQKDGQFIHPNLVAFLTPDLTIAKYLYGTDYDEADVRGALDIALGRGRLLNALAPYIFLIGVLGVIGTLFVILATLRRSGAAREGKG